MKIIDDTLKRGGKWSKQSLTFGISFLISIILGISNTIISYVSGMTNNNTSDNVFNAFMYLTAAMSGLNIGNKYVDMVRSRSQKDSSYQDYSHEEQREPLSEGSKEDIKITE